MATNQAIEFEAVKALRTPVGLSGGAASREANSGRWLSRWATWTFHAVAASPWWAFLVVVLSIACVAYVN